MRSDNGKFSCTFRKKICFLLIFPAIFFAKQFTVTAHADDQIYRSVKNDSKQIAFTFDDGPHPRLTKEILKILDRYHAKATFFMIGQNVKNYPETAKEVIQAGHEIGNHTFSHLHLEKMSAEQIDSQIDACNDALWELCNYKPHLFRPPEGAINTHICRSASQKDCRLVLWSIDTRDWERKNENEIVSTVLNKIQPGDIILMHDYIGYKSRTPQALELLLPRLIEQGYEPVTVSQLLGIDQKSNVFE